MQEIRHLMQDEAANVVQIGLVLCFVRETVGRSHFQQWLRDEFRWSQPQASNFMQAAKVFQHVEFLDRFQPSALVVLARKRAAG
jgi:hypothetical protein